MAGTGGEVRRNPGRGRAYPTTGRAPPSPGAGAHILLVMVEMPAGSLGPTHRHALEHDPEKCVAVFGKGLSQT
jgi:hypothetical protein